MKYEVSKGAMEGYTIHAGPWVDPTFFLQFYLQKQVGQVSYLLLRVC